MTGFVCDECGTTHATVNVVAVAYMTDRAQGVVDRQLCDECLSTLTGDVIGPCASCGDLEAMHTRETELEPWTCLSCSAQHRLAA